MSFNLATQAWTAHALLSTKLSILGKEEPETQRIAMTDHETNIAEQRRPGQQSTIDRYCLSGSKRRREGCACVYGCDFYFSRYGQ